MNKKLSNKQIKTQLYILSALWVPYIFFAVGCLSDLMLVLAIFLPIIYVALIIVIFWNFDENKKEHKNGRKNNHNENT